MAPAASCAAGVAAPAPLKTGTAGWHAASPCRLAVAPRTCWQKRWGVPFQSTSSDIKWVEQMW